MEELLMNNISSLIIQFNMECYNQWDFINNESMQCKIFSSMKLSQNKNMKKKMFLLMRLSY